MFKISEFKNIYDPENAPISYATADIKHESGKNDALSVSDALFMAKTGLETIRVKIIGEISEISNKPGYKAVYFTVKDKRSALPCLMWKNRFDSYGCDIEVGMLVEIVGRFSLYAAKGRMNFDVSSINVAGEGQLRIAVAKLAKKLEKAGLTSAERKRPIPSSPQRIGVVTSPRGAVIHDILRTLNRRSPFVDVVFAGCAVEGVTAANGMIEALRTLQDYSDNHCCDAPIEVILLCRGGGSFEDLMPFNDEDLAMTICESKIPVVTGIGHEPDTTIADLVSDMRASTPTGAAEAVSINAIDLICERQQRLDAFRRSIFNRINATKQLLASYSSRPVFVDGRRLFDAEAQSLDMFYNNISVLLQNFMRNYNAEVELSAAKLEDKSPLKILGRGYAFVKNNSDNVVKSTKDVKSGDEVSVTVSDGKFRAEVK